MSAALLFVTVLQALGAIHWPKDATLQVWVDSRNAPADAVQLVERAMKTWTDAAGGGFSLRTTPSRDVADVRVRFVKSDTNYGETAPRVDRRTGLITAADVVINADASGDLLNQRIIVYLTALHELGHALGLPHTDAFNDIMYSFRRPDDGERYFGAYRRRVRGAGDIGSPSATGLSTGDVAALHALYAR